MVLAILTGLVGGHLRCASASNKKLKAPVVRHCRRDLIHSIRRAYTLRRQSPGKK